MKLNKCFIVHDRGSDVILVPAFGASFSGVVKGNKSLGAILKCLKNDVTKQEIIDSLHNEFSDNSGLIEADVENALNQLKSIGAIDE